MSDHKVQDGCPEEGSSLNLLGVWPTTKARYNHIHLLDTATSCAEHVVTRCWGKLHQSRPSWDQCGQDWCWMGMGWLEVEIFTKMGSTTGFDWVRWKYIICTIKPWGWVAALNTKTDEYRLIYSVPLHGNGYDNNNHALWQEIQNCCIDTTSYDWIRDFESNKDGRVAWLALLHKYERNNSENKHIILANQYISLHPQQVLFYKNDHTLLFVKYIAGLQAAFAAITNYQNQVAQETMVKQLIYGIQVQNNLTSTLDKTKVKYNRIGNWLGAVSYMATKVTEDFGVAKENKN